jgi:hypothetical protein
MVAVDAALKEVRLFVEAKLTGKEAGDKMLVFNFPEFRFSFTANIFGE